jgi:uncharacterized protein (DUF924 family)
MNSKYDKYVDIILKYWFRGNRNADMKRWFRSGTEYDDEITKLFFGVLQEAEGGNLLHWLENRRSYLAHIILLDQFSRHIYRGTPDAYSNDSKILFFMEMARDRYIDGYNATQQMFILLPYQHAEHIKAQERGLHALKKLLKTESVATEKIILNTALRHQQGHLKVISEYGRFPKRNHILGRTSTVNEIKYMDECKNHPY